MKVLTLSTMKDTIKQLIRRILIFLRISATKNLEYDIYTERILERILQDDSNCIDVGAHKGEILDLFIGMAPRGQHFAFEPIPELHTALSKKYSNHVVVYPFALSNTEGKTTFNLVLDNPAYSGLQKRKYKTQQTQVKQIEVEMRRLDDVLRDRKVKINLIKIDVEGGEFDVMRGAVNILSKDHPTLIFECGKGASEFYGTTPGDIFEYITSLGYMVNTLKGFVKGNKAMDQLHFEQSFVSGSDYYFIASV